MQKILVVCPSRKDKSELISLPAGSNYSYIFQSYNGEYLERQIYEEENSRQVNILDIINEMIALYKNTSLDGILSSDDYPGETIASIVGTELKLPSPKPEVILLCQHKYYSRVAQKKYVPEAVPQFTLIDPLSFSHTSSMPSFFPFFVKPVKSYLSCYATAIKSQKDLAKIKNSLPTAHFLGPFNQLLGKYTDLKFNANYLIAEELLEGFQGTIEGYVYNGKIGFFGVVDSLMYQGTICFKRFQYPSLMPKEVQEKMANIASRCMLGMGFDNGLFNIEFMYNREKNTLHIIEINPRMASQFADLYEKVDGTNSYEVLRDIAIGKKPTVKKRQGPYKMAASCVLREFEDKLVMAVPDAENIDHIKKIFPGTKISVFAKKGSPLSIELQDGNSYRYCLVNLGADSEDDLERKLAHCSKELNFQFESI